MLFSLSLYEYFEGLRDEREKGLIVNSFFDLTVFLKKRIDSLSDLSSQLHSDLFLPLVTNLDGSDNLVLLLDRDIEALVMIRLHELLILRHR